MMGSNFHHGRFHTPEVPGERLPVGSHIDPDLASLNSYLSRLKCDQLSLSCGRVDTNSIEGFVEQLNSLTLDIMFELSSVRDDAVLQEVIKFFREIADLLPEEGGNIALCKEKIYDRADYISINFLNKPF